MQYFQNRARNNEVARILIKDFLEKLDGLECCHNDTTDATDLNRDLEHARARHDFIVYFITDLGNEGLGSWWAFQGVYARRAATRARIVQLEREIAQASTKF